MRNPAPRASRPPRSHAAVATLLALVVALAALPAAAGAADGTGADTSVDTSASGASSVDRRLQQARNRVAAAQRAADEAAAAVEDGLTRHAELESQIAQREDAIAQGERIVDALSDVVEQRAVEAYMGGTLDASDLFQGGDVIDMLRRTELIDRANAEGNAAIDSFEALSDELESQREQLAADRAELEAVIEQLRADEEVVQAELYDAYAARQVVEEQIAAEQEAARKAAEDAAREAAEEEARRAASTTTTPAPARGGTTPPASGSSTPPATDPPASTPPPSSPPPPPPPQSSGFICPIAGPVSFIDSWHFPRSGGRLHEGVDLMSPRGTPNVAVVSGYVSFRYGSRQGYGAFLYGDDGNTYYYFHLSSYAGSARRVAQGETIGYVGDSGNAVGINHTHFEYHPGGGAAVNPYPLVAAAC